MRFPSEGFDYINFLASYAGNPYILIRMEQAACFCDSLNVLDVLLLLFVSVTDPHGFSITFSIFQIETDPSKQSTSRSFPEPVFQEEEGKKESNNQVIDVKGMLSYKVHSACLPASLFIR
jgi:hypothetical protein